MRRLERFNLLQLFGDGKPHDWFNTVFLGVQFLKTNQVEFEKLFKRALENNLIRRMYKKAHFKDDYYIIAKLGDDCLRDEQIARHGEYEYYKKFDRSVHGQYGVDHFAPLPKGVQEYDA